MSIEQVAYKFLIVLDIFSPEKMMSVDREWRCSANKSKENIPKTVEGVDRVLYGMKAISSHKNSNLHRTISLVYIRN
jgi:hypothetical protein